MRTTVILLVVGSLLGSRQTLAQILINGGFEDPAISQNSYSTIIQATGWSGLQALFNGDGGNASLWPGPQQGAQYADIGWGNTPAMSQAVTISAPGDYRLCWYDNTAYFQTIGSPYSVTILDSVDAVVASSSFAAVNDGSNAWAAKFVPATLASGAYTIRFQSVTGGAAYDVLIDSVAMVPVPEPDDCGLLVCLGSVVLITRRCWQRIRCLRTRS